MLYVDSDHITLLDLMAIDSEVPEIAGAEGIIVDGVGGIIREAWEECADTLLESMPVFGEGMRYASQPGFLNNGGFGVNRSRICLEQIVVTAADGRQTSALKRWLLYRALETFYRNAVGRRITDRYQAKLANAEDMVTKRWRTLRTLGLPIVYAPLPCPGATHEQFAGTFSASNLGSMPGPIFAPATTYDVAITWVDQSRYVSPTAKNSGESGPSVRLAFTVPTDELLTVSITGLLPPKAATAWNIYVGTPDGLLSLHNDTPIAVGTSAYFFADSPDISEYLLSDGQTPDANLAFQNIFQRA